MSWQSVEKATMGYTVKTLALFHTTDLTVCTEAYCHYADGCNQTSEMGILINYFFMLFTLNIIFVDLYVII